MGVTLDLHLLEVTDEGEALEEAGPGFRKLRLLIAVEQDGLASELLDSRWIIEDPA